ncbi:hypothetical protein L596_025603 [Steinernema carpocapsae]|uniref:Uncharacterized protein n=1 Tax=Steinernema carpocapsae TaxID=34508 RepID=A0A4V5ZYV4_STECR|nr:hypothetical protein L596_025603 [Steinernema carpocapsae]
MKRHPEAVALISKQQNETAEQLVAIRATADVWATIEMFRQQFQTRPNTLGHPEAVGLTSRQQNNVSRMSEKLILEFEKAAERFIAIRASRRPQKHSEARISMSRDLKTAAPTRKYAQQ